MDAPEGEKPISCKWIFKGKLRPDDTIEKYKAKLLAKGFSQKEGIDSFDIYAPVCRITTIRVLIAWVDIKKFIIHQMDMKTVFLNGDLSEEIYMKKPEGLNAPLIDKVCKLTKFDRIVHSNGHRVSESDKFLYINVAEGKVVVICLYVDDMLISLTDLKIVKYTKKISVGPA